MTTEKSQKIAKKFYCKNCDYTTGNKYDYEKHTLTAKHKNKTNYNDFVAKNKEYSCKCGKIYPHRASLYNHKKICSYIEIPLEDNLNPILYSESIIITNDNNNIKYSDDNKEIMKLMIKEHEDFKNIILDVFKSNSEFQKQILELVKNTNITNNTNCHNNTFNLQLFLNEECKDAMNISDFVNSVNIQLEDLEDVGRLGYATGMSNIIVKELKMLDVYKRPIHCSDIKREIFYVKDNDVWERETPENSKMKKAIKGISKKNMVKLNDWRDKHPDCLDSSSSYNDIYLNLMVESCGGRGDFTAGENKILKNIAKEVVIKK